MSGSEIDAEVKWVDLTRDVPNNIYWKADLIDVSVSGKSMFEMQKH